MTRTAQTALCLPPGTAADRRAFRSSLVVIGVLAALVVAAVIRLNLPQGTCGDQTDGTGAARRAVGTRASKCRGPRLPT